MLAKDYKMDPLWHSESSSAAAKASLIAHKRGPNLNLWEPSASGESKDEQRVKMRELTNV